MRLLSDLVFCTHFPASSWRCPHFHTTPPNITIFSFFNSAWSPLSPQRERLSWKAMEQEPEETPVGWNVHLPSAPMPATVGICWQPCPQEQEPKADFGCAQPYNSWDTEVSWFTGWSPVWPQGWGWTQFATNSRKASSAEGESKDPKPTPGAAAAARSRAQIAATGIRQRACAVKALHREVSGRAGEWLQHCHHAASAAGRVCRAASTVVQLGARLCTTAQGWWRHLALGNQLQTPTK